MTRGDRIKYRALASDVYDAEVTGIRTDGTIDIDVILGPDRRLSLTHIPVGRGNQDGEAFIPASAPV